MNWIQEINNTNAYLQTSIYGDINPSVEGIDLRQEMDWILNGGPNRIAKGHWIVYRRFNHCTESEYFNRRTKEGVGGPANTYTDIAIKTRRVPYRLASSQPEEIKAGQLIDARYTYYFEWDITPKRNDQIFELNIPGPAPASINISDVKFTEKYIIKNVHPFRLENGRIEYWSVATEYSEVQE